MLLCPSHRSTIGALPAKAGRSATLQAAVWIGITPCYLSAGLPFN